MVDTWTYFHRFDSIETSIECFRCVKAYHKDYKPFFNISGQLVCYDCVNESSAIPYNLKDNFPNLKPHSWYMGRPTQENNIQ
jgi:hypothetical protein